MTKIRIYDSIYDGYNKTFKIREGFVDGRRYYLMNAQQLVDGYAKAEDKAQFMQDVISGLEKKLEEKEVGRETATKLFKK